mgnify:CR=1 FL=1
MRVSTANSYDNTIALLTRRQAELSAQQERVTTGMRVTKPSDDPVAATLAETAANRLSRTNADLRALDLTEPLRALLTWDQTQTLDHLAPSHYETPMGRRVPIDYDGEAPGIEVRLQEMFGVTRHPTLRKQLFPAAAQPLSLAPLTHTGDGIDRALKANAQLDNGHDSPGLWMPCSIRTSIW